MFKEDIKIKILNEEHFKKVKEILVKGCDGESGAYLNLEYVKPFKESNTK